MSLERANPKSLAGIGLLIHYWLTELLVAAWNERYPEMQLTTDITGLRHDNWVNLDFPVEKGEISELGAKIARILDIEKAEEARAIGSSPEWIAVADEVAEAIRPTRALLRQFAEVDNADTRLLDWYDSQAAWARSRSKGKALYPELRAQADRLESCLKLVNNL